MSAPVSDLATLGAEVDWPDAEAAALARSDDRSTSGRLAELLEWLSGARGAFPPPELARPRCIVVGDATPAALSLADSLDVGVHEVAVPHGDAGGSRVDAALTAGTSVADDEIDAGADLLVLADPGDSTVAGALTVSLLTGAEPVALLPRGAGAVDTDAWVSKAVGLRDGRRAIGRGGDDPDTLLAALGDARLALTTAVLLRAATRRTPVVVDGTGALVAGLVAARVQPRSARWWRVADSSPDPVHARALADVGTIPMLDLQTATGDGVAGLLTIPLLRAATNLGTAP